MEYINVNTGDYPVTEAMIKSLHPNTSFTNPFQAPEEFAVVFPAPSPNHNSETEILLKGIPVLTHKGHYEQTWNVAPRFTDYADEAGAIHTVQSQIDAVFNRKKLELIKRIDADVDQIMRDCIGERATEYQRAESQARAFKAVNYSGIVPTPVRVWAETKGWSNTQAADDIIAQADLWIAAQDAIREHRLKAKEAYRVASSNDQLNTALATWVAFSNYIRNQLGV